MRQDECISEILDWVSELAKNISVDIRKISPDECTGWFYDVGNGRIHNKKNTFFSVGGIAGMYRGARISQPIIHQNEVGYLGLLACRIDREICFLMQAKLEPGNINCIQLSPTVQATKSNYTQQHGGATPAYLDYFVNASPERIIVDQIQSEQSSRFLGKRNRNIIVWIDNPGNVEVGKNHRWISFSVLKELMKHDNLVNMDTRTVLSCIPYSLMPESFWGLQFDDPCIKKSVFSRPNMSTIVRFYHAINNLHMLNKDALSLVSLYSLEDWHFQNSEFVCDSDYAFKLIFCDISIEGREVRHWCQPLFEAVGRAVFGLIYREKEGITEFLIKVCPEIGCFDIAEAGPTVQREAVCTEPEDSVTELFYRHLETGRGVVFDTLLSEEGGRFYHEENRNVIIHVDENELSELPDGYVWCGYSTLNMLTQVNNCLNIQLRNLLSVFDLFGGYNGKDKNRCSRAVRDSFQKNGSRACCE
ncbi:MAG: NDP-hexose 2,3-dehydratase family protein [Christensenella sp.]|nr:NDP-hexose 2,3-dehydratase family protein [Christensenella sp.]